MSTHRRVNRRRSSFLMWLGMMYVYPVVPVMTTKGGRIPSFFSLVGWGAAEATWKKKIRKIETSIDALLFPSRLAPPGPYGPQQSPRHQGLPVCRNENGRTNGLDPGRDQHAVVTAYGKLPYSDSQGKRSPDAERHGLVYQLSSRKCRFVTQAVESIITSPGRFTDECCDQFHAHRNTVSGSKVGTSCRRV